MAELIQEERYPQTISVSFSWWKVLLIGAAIGALYYLLTALIGRFFIDPMYCKTALEAANCANSLAISGNIANILVGAIGLGALVGLRVVRPLIIVGASVVLLWGLSTWTVGLFWVEAVAWDALLFGLAYLLFGWICRFNRTTIVVIIAILLSLIARIVTSL